jgi:hypothetical protein
VVSHVIEGVRHYGAVLSPQQSAQARLPLLLYLHGRDGGVSVEELSLLAGSTGIDPNAAVLVIPGRVLRRQRSDVLSATRVPCGPA